MLLLSFWICASVCVWCLVGVMRFLIVIVIAFGNVIVIILDLCLSVCVWLVGVRFLILIVNAFGSVIVIILDLCLSLCVWLVGVRFLRKCSNLLYSHPIQAFN